ncbi:MAG: hypothetical protein MZW92_65950 [Comamonadaceae bacterium]|nr:hypothetical protein [Comamonadaceae bacterium]
MQPREHRLERVERRRSSRAAITSSSGDGLVLGSSGRSNCRAPGLLAAGRRPARRHPGALAPTDARQVAALDDARWRRAALCAWQATSLAGVEHPHLALADDRTVTVSPISRHGTL